MNISFLSVYTLFLCYMSKEEDNICSNLSIPIFTSPIVNSILNIGKLYSSLRHDDWYIGNIFYFKPEMFSEKKVHRVCRGDEIANSTLIERALAGDFEFEADETIMKYFFCEFYSKEYIDEYGIFNPDKYLDGLTQEQIEIASRGVEICTDVLGRTREETAWLKFKCLLDTYKEEYIPLKMNEKCMNNTGITKKLAWKVINNNFNEADDNFKNYTYCFYMAEDLIDIDGNINRNITFSWMSKTISPDTDSKVFAMCSKHIPTVSDSEEAWKLTQCLLNTALIFTVGSKTCTGDEIIDTEKLAKAYLGDFDFEPDDAIKKYVFCDYVVRRWLNENGILIKNNYLAGLSKDVEKHSEYADICATKTGATREESGWNVFKCLIETYQANNLPMTMNAKCMKESQLTNDVAWKAVRNGYKTVEKSFEIYIFCFLKEEGIINADGKLNKEKLSSPFDIAANEKMSKLYKRCSKKADIITNSEEAWKVAKCFLNFKA